MRLPHIRGWRKRWRGGRGHQTADAAGGVARTLASVEPGREVSVAGYTGNSGGQRRHLQAYGLLPGRRVRVLSQRPVTIVQIEETELAVEDSVAACVLVGD